MAEYLQAQIIPHGLEYFYPGGFVETGFPDQLLCQNMKGEFCYLNLQNIERPHIEVITPGFPGVGGEIGSDAENRVAWIVRGRGVYFIDLDTKKTGHMVAGNQGRVTQVLLTDKERLLFAVLDFAGEANGLYSYELSIKKDYGMICAFQPATFNTLGKNKVLLEITIEETPKFTGWYLTDTFLTNIRKKPGSVLPGGSPLTKALMDNNVHAVNRNNKLLHQSKRLLYGWSRLTLSSSPVLATFVCWSEDLEDIKVSPLLQLSDTKSISYSGGVSRISCDGNWLLQNRIHRSSRMQERLVLHIQDYYPTGASIPVSLGYTNQDPGAFLTHSKLGPLFVEQPLARTDTLRVFKLNDAIEIIKKQALGVVSKLTQK